MSLMSRGLESTLPGARVKDRTDWNPRRVWAASRLAVQPVAVMAVPAAGAAVVTVVTVVTFGPMVP